MANSTITVTTIGSGTLVDTELLTVGANSVHRQRLQLAGTAAAAITAVLNTDPALADYGAVVRLVGQVQHDAADGGAPIKIGGRADTTNQAAVADGDRVDAWFSPFGALLGHSYPILPSAFYIPGDATLRAVGRSTINDVTITASTNIVAAAGASLYLYLLALIVGNSSGTAGVVTLEQQTGGADLAHFYLPATSVPVLISAPKGTFLAKSAANDGINAISSAAGTKITGLAIHVASTVSL